MRRSMRGRKLCGMVILIASHGAESYGSGLTGRSSWTIMGSMISYLGQTPESCASAILSGSRQMPISIFQLDRRKQKTPGGNVRRCVLRWCMNGRTRFAAV
ncbi:hypothetical protein EDB80DRAFT_742871 [Ilyonectria destructans]|nr:hypothetical protein EDB80DRAFT_742871 [Ilyonectria destructans]